MDPWLLEFRHWTTEEEEVAAYGERFVVEYLPHLPHDIQSIILRKYWGNRYKNALPFGLINAPWGGRYVLVKKKYRKRFV